MNFGLIGGKLSHSYSPQIHKMFFDKFRINGDYKLYELKEEELEKFCLGAKKSEIQGFNITIPYKESIFPFMDVVDPKAEKIGAINTVKSVEGKLYAYNTDYYGYLYSLKKLGVDLEGQRAIVLGNGGSAKAVIEVCKDLGAKEIYLVSRNPNKNAPEGVIAISYEELKTLGKAKLITNCTPVGMYPNIDNSPIEKELFENYDFAIDLIYNPKETKFLEYAREMGKSTINGLYMLLGQALKAEELWQNKEISLETIDSLYENLEKIVYKD